MTKERWYFPFTQGKAVFPVHTRKGGISHCSLIHSGLDGIGKLKIIMIYYQFFYYDHLLHCCYPRLLILGLESYSMRATVSYLYKGLVAAAYILFFLLSSYHSNIQFGWVWRVNILQRASGKYPPPWLISLPASFFWVGGSIFWLLLKQLNSSQSVIISR